MEHQYMYLRLYVGPVISSYDLYRITFNMFYISTHSVPMFNYLCLLVSSPFFLQLLFT